MKRWSGHSFQVSVWEPTAARYSGLGAVTPDEGVVVLVAEFGKHHKGVVGRGVRGMIQKCFYVCRVEDCFDTSLKFTECPFY